MRVMTRQPHRADREETSIVNDMSAQSILTADLWKASVELTEPTRIGDRLNTFVPAATILNEARERLTVAIGIVGSRPYMMDARQDGDTFHDLSIHGATAELKWARCGSVLRGGLLVERCTFPARLLDMTMSDLADWQNAQSGTAE